MKQIRVFVDTSVFGGLFDAEFAEDTLKFFDLAEAGRVLLAVSAQVESEIDSAPPRVRVLFDTFLPSMEYYIDSEEVQNLVELYMQSGVLGEKSRIDATHVAQATVHGCAGVVSWNYRHIVRPDKSSRFNLVNASHGYPQLFIITPKEVIHHEKED